MPHESTVNPEDPVNVNEFRISRTNSMNATPTAAEANLVSNKNS